MGTGPVAPEGYAVAACRWYVRERGALLQVTVLLWICSVPLIAEFAVAPFNLWSGRTMPNFVRFTGLQPAVARRIVAPLKLLGAALLGAGLAVSALGAAGAAVLSAVSAFYLVRLLRGRPHQLDGLVAFGISLALAVAVLILQLTR
jgi:hypothetical protein